ncbi:hypothetical protein BCR34DRAFT_600473 [Clohesyomyces aquaticus]|uniref:Uncharacterized protein n=1 Tax=Clohesyomyces aquaticus TaxID=1231657 RepID=A0A1Y1ZQQ0_9PLEO|nr:hypothetical protein BCR34DRAFT_600473 [Clohesyomyces aquaticus]
MRKGQRLGSAPQIESRQYLCPSLPEPRLSVEGDFFDGASHASASSTAQLVCSLESSTNDEHEIEAEDGGNPTPTQAQSDTPPSQQIYRVAPAELAPMPQQTSTQPTSLHTQSRPSSASRRQEFAEWKPWQTQWPYLSLLLITVIAFIIAIAILQVISKRHSGFAGSSNPPAFLVRHPRIRKAIWDQGILYTALPAFIMTVYRTMWDSSVMATADRQPYIDLARPQGAHPNCTILLDYKSEPLLSRWVLGFRNGHYILAACLLSSLVLSFAIIPLTSFLFIMDLALIDSTFPLSFDSAYNATSMFQFPRLETPDIRLALDAAAGFHLQNSSVPPWTDGTYAFPKLTPLTEISNNDATLTTFANGAQAACVVIPENEYQRTVHGPPETGTEAYIIEVTATDRGCPISSFLGVRADIWSPTTALSSWYTPSCSFYAGYTRLSLLAASYDRASQSIQNISLISCQNSYFNTSGTLTVRSNSHSTATSILAFAPDNGTRTEDQETFMPLRRFFEMQLNTFECINTDAIISGNEFVQYVFRLSSQLNPESPLDSSSLANATQILFQTTHAIFAATNLFQHLREPVISNGTNVVAEQRLFIVDPVSYIILTVLSCTAILNILLFFHARQVSILKEEPYGLLSAGGVLYKSDINTVMMEEVLKENGCSRRARKTAERLYMMEDVKCYWHAEEGKITCDRLLLQDLGRGEGP